MNIPIQRTYSESTAIWEGIKIDEGNRHRIDYPPNPNYLTMPLNAPKGTYMTVEECGEGMMPVMLCEGIHPSLKEYAVATSHHSIQQGVEIAKNMPPQMLRHIFVSSLRSLTQWTEEELHSHWASQNQQWNDFCDDVAIFYTTRAVLMKKAIPIDLQSQEEIDAKMMGVRR